MWVGKVVMEAFQEGHIGEELWLGSKGWHVHEGGSDMLHLGDGLFLGGEFFRHGSLGFTVERKGLKGVEEVSNVHWPSGFPGLLHNLAVGRHGGREEEDWDSSLADLE